MDANLTRASNETPFSSPTHLASDTSSSRISSALRTVKAFTESAGRDNGLPPTETHPPATLILDLHEQSPDCLHKLRDHLDLSLIFGRWFDGFVFGVGVFEDDAGVGPVLFGVRAFLAGVGVGKYSLVLSHSKSHRVSSSSLKLLIWFCSQ